MLVALCGAIFLASVIGTVAGFGIATTLMPVALFFFPVKIALLFTGIIHWWVSLWMVVFYKSEVNLHILLWFGVPSIVASMLGALIATSINTALFTPILGVFMICYALSKFFMPNFAVPPHTTTLSLGGLLSGFSAGLFGIRGAITSLFVSLFNLSKETYLVTMGSIAILVDTVRVLLYGWGFGAQLSSTAWWALLIGVPVSLAGAFLGRRIVHLLPQRIFYIAVSCFLILTGIRLILL